MTDNTGVAKPFHFPYTTITATTGALPTTLGLIDAQVTADATYTLPPLQDAIGQMLPGSLLSIRNMTAFSVTVTSIGDDTVDGGGGYVVNSMHTVDVIASPVEYQIWCICDMTPPEPPAV